MVPAMPPGEGNGNPLQYSCQENPMDRGTWWATVHGVPRVGQDKRLNHHRAAEGGEAEKHVTRRGRSGPLSLIRATFFSFIP